MQCSINSSELRFRYNDTCIWTRKDPTTTIMLIYGFGVPSMAIFGVCANFINTIVFMRPNMTPSAFSYLAALSALDCLSCMLITLTAFSRSILFNSGFWLVYDFQWQVPLFGITSGAANLVLACVSLDRLIYLHSGVPGLNRPPRFCRRKIARRMIFGAILISLAVNMPYFFIFKVNGDDKTFHTTDFYYSNFYAVHNWFTFCLLGILPAIFLLIGNAAILIVFCRWTRKSKTCPNKGNKTSKTTEKRYKHQMKLTVTILIVITLYMFGELPAHLTSRKSILNLLYRGDITKVDLEGMQRLEVICMILSSVQLSMNIIVYAIINPCFMPEFFTCLRSASDFVFKLCGCSSKGYCCNIFYHCQCWHCCNKKTKPEQHQQPLPQEHSDERRKSVDSVSSSGDNWDGKVPTQVCKDLDAGSNIIEMGHMARPPVCLAKKYSLACIETRRIGTNLKRSSSLEKFAYDNTAIDISEENSTAATEETEPNGPSKHQSKEESRKTDCIIKPH